MQRITLVALALTFASSCYEVDGGCAPIPEARLCHWTVDIRQVAISGVMRLRVQSDIARQGSHAGVCWDAIAVEIHPELGPDCEVTTILEPRQRVP